MFATKVDQLPWTAVCMIGPTVLFTVIVTDHLAAAPFIEIAQKLNARTCSAVKQEVKPRERRNSAIGN